jgi:DNA-binding NtrC family response regulator
MDALTRYSWPGNVRELINVIERAVLLCPGPTIDLDDLPRAVSAHAGLDGPVTDDLASLTCSFSRMFESPLLEARQRVSAEFERLYLTEALRATGGRIGKAAERAGVNQRSLYQMMRRHDLRKEDFKIGG